LDSKILKGLLTLNNLIGFILIGIVLIGALIAGYIVLQGMGFDSVVENDPVCLSQVNQEMTQFKVALEDTVAKKNINTFEFNPVGKCYSSPRLTMKIVFETSKTVCEARCGYPSDSCQVLTFINPDFPNAFNTKCLDLPAFTTFLNDSACSDLNLSSEGYSLIDLNSANILQPGIYSLRNISSSSDIYPKVCVGYKKIVKKNIL
jgi:hypothetical protein